jgi:hypothetical protein
MGISVPIATEYYKLLKEISDERGLGLKRTLEFLVTYYNEKEKAGKESPQKKFRKVPAKKRQKDPPRVLQKEKLPDPTSFEQTPSIDTNIEQKGYFETISATTSEIEANKKSDDTLWEHATNDQQLFSPLPSESELLAAEKQKYMTPENFIKQVSRSINQCCYSCGFPKRPNAKFCTNCGIHLKNTNEDQSTYTIP